MGFRFGKSIIVRLYAGCIALIILPVLLTVFLSFFTYQRSLYDLSVEQSVMEVQGAVKSLRGFVDKMDTVTARIYQERQSFGFSNPTAFDYLARDRVYRPDPAGEERVIRAFLEQLIDYEPDYILNALLVREDGAVWMRSNPKASNSLDYSYDFLAQEWYRALLENPSRRMQVVPQSAFSADFLYSRPRADILLLARGVYDVDSTLNTERIAMLLLVIDTARFESLFPLHADDVQHFYLLDRERAVVYGSSKDGLGEDFAARVMTVGGSSCLRTKDDYYICQWVEEAQMAVLGQVSLESLRRPFLAVQQWTAGAVAVFLGLSVLALWLLRRTVARPVNVILENMKRMEGGAFDGFAPTPGSSEFDVINEGLIDMAANLKDNMDHALLAEREKQRAEFYTLQSQIKPHFILNVLETLRMNLSRNGDAEDARAAMLLGRVLREKLADPDKMGCLREEMELVEAFAEIQRYRFGTAPRLVNTIPRSLQEVPAPRLLVQPLVENAMKHAFPQAGEQDTVTVGAYSQGGRLVVTVMDNGCGIAPDALGKLQTGLEERRPYLDAEHIGLRNVSGRLYSLYGEDASMRLSSIVGEGTVVQVNLPVGGREEGPCSTC